METYIPFGQAWINGMRVVFNPYQFRRGRNKGKFQVFYKKGKGFKKIILSKNDIRPLKEVK